jgi:hypothetical protein
MLRAPLVLLLLCLALPASATWHVFSTNGATAIDFRNPHQGVLSMNDVKHLIQVYQDGNLNGVFQAPDVVTGLTIQDSLIAWATVSGNGLYIGTKHWSNWKQTSSRSDLTLIASTPSRLFVYSLGQLYYTIDGLNLNAASGIPQNDSITAMDYLTDDIVFAASRTKLYRSTNQGQDWTLVASGMKACTTLFADRSNNLVYAGGDTIRKSTNGGVTWSTMKVPLPFTWSNLSGDVVGTHDCTGVFYVVADQLNTNYQLIRSSDQGRRFESIDNLPPLASPLRHAWVFDRGATFWWWDWTVNNGAPNLASSDDGIDGFITDSVAMYLSALTDPIYDTACGASTPFTLSLFSSICTPIHIDSVTATTALGKINKLQFAKTLQGDSTTVAINYLPLESGTDSITLHVWLHGLEWKIPEYVDVTTNAFVSGEPAKLGAVSDLDFGSVRTDSVKTLTLSIPNVGCQTLRIDSIVSTDPSIFSIDGWTMPLYLKSDSVLQVPLYFAPRSSGRVVESIEIGTNAGHEFVTVQGSGVKVLSDVMDVNEQNIRIYPNPASTTLRTSARATIIVFDLLGREWLRGIGESFDVSLLPAGQYFVRMNGETIPLSIARP